MAEREFERLDKQSYECKKKGKNLGEIPIRKKSVNFILYGFGEECKKAGDLENFERIKKIIEKFGNLNECENFVMKRSGKDGEFQTLEEDIPIEIRKKIKELNG